ncbi:hypothetical protein Hanom_Chr10g00957651 [Helianthus anomalus]
MEVFVFSSNIFMGADVCKCVDVTLEDCFNRSELSFLSKLPFWYLRFVYFCHFIPKLISFASGSLWFQFYFHFGPKVKSGHIYFIKSCYFVLYLRGKMVISYLFYLKLLLKGLCNRFKFWTKIKKIYMSATTSSSLIQNVCNSFFISLISITATPSTSSNLNSLKTLKTLKT